MNENAKLLAGRALDKAVSYTWTKLDYEQIQELLACHAELIVQECVSVVEGLSPGYEDYRNQIEDAFRRDCVAELKQHFGVEE